MRHFMHTFPASQQYKSHVPCMLPREKYWEMRIALYFLLPLINVYVISEIFPWQSVSHTTLSQSFNITSKY
jgi:hypothetical protein